MTIFPKRVWTKKGMVFHDKKPVRQLGDKVGVYDPNFTEIDSGEVYPEKAWENVPATDELLIYDGEQPTEIGTFEDGLESTYQFVDYDGSVLKSGKVKDGETPVAPADPTREHYTFTGWNPTVGPINKNTTYSAVYAIDTFTVNIGVNNPDYGDVSMSSLGSVSYGTAISASDNVLTIGETTITATAETGYQFSSWGTLPATVTENLTITATFIASTIPVTELDDGLIDGIDVVEGGTTTATMSYLPVNANDFSALTIAPDTESSYSGSATGVLTSYENGVATVTITGVTTGEYSLRATVENGGTSTSCVFHGYVVEPNL